MRKAVPVLHPICFALYPVLLAYSKNVNLVQFSDILRSLFVSLAGCMTLLLLFQLLLQDWRRAGLVTTWIVLLFSTFGHVYFLLLKVMQSTLRVEILAACWAVGLILGTWWIARKLRHVSAHFTIILNLVGAAALFMATLTPAVFLVRRQFSRSVAAPQQPGRAVIARAETGQTPDIYYIIMDGFGRPDVLSEIYGVDLSDLVGFLEERGFDVAKESYSNYNRTIPSVTSSLNFQYLDQLIPNPPAGEDYGPMKQMLESNAAVQFLRQRGYRFVMISGGYSDINITSADQFITSAWSGGMTYFETTLLSRTAAIFYLNQVIPTQRHALMNDLFTRVVAQADQPGPKFVFAHIMLPHPPFIFDRAGNPVVNSGNGEAEGDPFQVLDVRDGSDYPGDRMSYIHGYHEQVLYTSQKTREMITEILDRSEIPPVMILQGDHGPGAFLDWGSSENTCLRERFSILNAIYLPGNPQDVVYPQMSPINTFRVVFNEYFGAGLPLLEDRSIFTVRWRPYEYEAVDLARLEVACPAP